MPIVGSGGGGGIEWHNGFNLNGWAQSKNGELESLTWSIEGDIDPKSGEPKPSIPDKLKNHAPLLVEFDAEQKKLYVSLEFCEAYGVEVNIVGKSEAPGEL